MEQHGRMEWIIPPGMNSRSSPLAVTHFIPIPDFGMVILKKAGNNSIRNGGLRVCKFYGAGDEKVHDFGEHEIRRCPE